MKLSVKTREGVTKGELNKLRREGYIPAVIYVEGKASESVAIKNDEFTAAMRQVVPGRLPTSIFTLLDAKGKERRFVLKEIQYHPTTYQVMHLDFAELHDNSKINVKVPIECTGVADCQGIKLGGALRQVIRYLPISCLPKDMPEAFELDIRDLGPRESKRLRDLNIPTSVRPLADLNEVAVVIVKR